MAVGVGNGGRRVRSDHGVMWRVASAHLSLQVAMVTSHTCMQGLKVNAPFSAVWWLRCRRRVCARRQRPEKCEYVHGRLPTSEQGRRGEEEKKKSEREMRRRI